MYLWILLWKINTRMLPRGKRIVSENKFCSNSSEFTASIFFGGGKPGSQLTHPRRVLSLDGRWKETIANLCWGLGVHKVWRTGDYAHVDVPLLHLTETTSFWCHPSSVHVGVQWSSHCFPPEETLTHTQEESVKAAPRSSLRHNQFNASFKGSCASYVLKEYVWYFRPR